MKKNILLSLIIVALSGCTLTRDFTNPADNIPSAVTPIVIPAQTTFTEPANELMQSSLSSSLTIVSLESSDALPDFQVPDLAISNASITDVMALIKTVYPLSYSIDRTIDGLQAQNNTLTGIKLGGKFKDVIDKLSQSMGFFYKYQNGTLYIQPDMQFLVTIPPSEQLLDSSASTIENLGGRNVNLNKATGIVSFTASRPVHSLINNYIKYVKETRSVIAYDTWIYEVSLTDSRETGIQWNKFSYANGANSGTLNGSSGMTAATPLGLSLIFSKGNFSLDALVQFLQTQGNLKTVSQPKLAVLNGEKGTIKAGRKITYISQISQTPGIAGAPPTSSATTSTLQLGTDLTLTPHIDEGTIYSKIELRVDDLNQLAVNNIFGSQITLPDTVSREIITTIRARSGDTILLGGVSTTRDLNNREGVPLGSNALTNHVNLNSTKSELVIILKPQIVKFKGL
jgi:MSHA biogenesis protein MshL